MSTNPPEGGGDFADLFSQLQSARSDLEAKEEAVEATVVEGHAAEGAVTIAITGGLALESVRIDRSIVDPDDVELLEDAVFAALRDALDQVAAVRAEALAAVDPRLGGSVDLGAMVGNLDLAGMLGGIDVESLLGGTDLNELMGSLGMAQPGAPGAAALEGTPGAGADTDEGPAASDDAEPEA